MTTQEYDGAILAQAAWREAQGASIDTVLCVAHTIKNLATLKEIGIGEAIVQHRKLHGLTVTDEDFPDVRDPVFVKILRRIDDMLYPGSDDLTNGAIYYLNMTTSEPRAVMEVLKDPASHPMVGVAGAMHLFK